MKKYIFRSDSDRERPAACQLCAAEIDFPVSAPRKCFPCDAPISINYVDKQRNEVWFLIQLVGDGTKRLGAAKQGRYNQCSTSVGKLLHNA